MSHYRIHGLFTLRSPLSHIGESVSTQTFLVQEPILQEDGSVEQVFCYNGNAWRGQLRDCAAAYFLDRMGTDGHAQVPLDIFHLLFTGGRIGGDQSIDIDQARRIRAAVPMVSVWGGGVGNQIMAGKMRVSNAYPLVREALPVLPERWHMEACKASYADITFDKSFTRTDDTKSESLREYLPSENFGLLDGPRKTKSGNEVADQMRMTTELVAPGTRLCTEIDVLDPSDIELGAMVSAIHQWSQSPHIGGQANKGHGKVRLDYRMLNMETGEDQEFICITADGPCLLSEPAQQAKDAYDQHLRALYDRMLQKSKDGIRGLIGAV